MAADILLTDYSSIQFDFSILGRPIVIYAHDWELYAKLRGVYFDLPSEPPGAVARTEEDLAEIFRTGSYESAEACANLAAFRKKFCDYEDGQAAERVVRRVFMREPIKQLRPKGDLPPVPTLAPDPFGTVPPRRVATAEAS